MLLVINTIGANVDDNFYMECVWFEQLMDSSNVNSFGTLRFNNYDTDVSFYSNPCS